MNKPKRVIVLHIKGKTLRSVRTIVLVDIFLGTGLYFAAKWVTSSILLATIGSMAGSEGYKWRLRHQRSRVVTVPKREWLGSPL